MDKKRPLISLCMIVKNEADNLPRCLISVENLVDEMVIVDTGSTDETPDIARQFDAEVFEVPWQDDFSAAKNAAIDRAGGQWILVLDADEELHNPSENAPLLRQLLRETKADAFEMLVRNVLPAGDIMQFQDFWLTRLFRNHPEYRYEGRIHEQVRPAIERNGGALMKLDTMILHHGYSQSHAQNGISRVARNNRLLEKALQEDPQNAYLRYHLGAGYKDQGRMADAETELQLALELGAQLTPEILEKVLAKLAQLALARDDYHTAAVFAGRCLNINPKNLIGLYIGSLALIYSGNFHSAMEGFQAIQMHPQVSPAELPQIQQIVQFCEKRIDALTKV